MTSDAYQFASAMHAASTRPLSSASERARVVQLVAMLTTAMDAEVADAISIVQAEAPDRWAVVGYVMREATKQLTTPWDDVDGVPTCPAEVDPDTKPGVLCGARRWKVDNDVITRAAVIVGDTEEVLVDRCAGEARLDLIGSFDTTPIELPGNVSCMACSYEVDPSGDAERFQRIAAAARNLVQRGDGPWRVITDYRQF